MNGHVRIDDWTRYRLCEARSNLYAMMVYGIVIVRYKAICMQ